MKTPFADSALRNGSACGFEIPLTEARPLLKELISLTDASPLHEVLKTLLHACDAAIGEGMPIEFV